MTSGVTRRYEFTATWDVLFDIISSNISDPLTGEQARKSASEWIKNGFPNIAKLGQVGGFKFPLIVIRLPTISAKNMVVSGEKQAITTSSRIECYSTSREGAISLGEEIKYILDVTGQSELRKAELYGPDLIGTDEDTLFIGANKYYGYSMDFEFKRFD